MLVLEPWLRAGLPDILWRRHVCVHSQVPLAAVSNYSTQLRSMTGGEGSYTMEFSHFEPVPANIQQEIVSKAKRPVEEED